MAERKTQTTKKATTKAPSKKVVKENIEKSVVSDFLFIPNHTYKVTGLGKGGLIKDKEYEVSGVVAGSLVKQGLAKHIN